MISINKTTLNTKVNIKHLQKLADKNLTLNEISTELDLPMSTIRSYMRKHNISTDSQEKTRVIRKYFSASTPKDKDKAFEKVDEYLKQIAQKDFEQKKGPTFEDCLQDARLKFFEIIYNGQKKGRRPQGILKEIETSNPAKNIIDTEILENNIPATNTLIDTFEGADFQTHFLNYFRSKAHKIATIFEKQLIEDKSIYEIANDLGLWPQRVQQLLENRIHDNVEILFKKMISPERIQSHASHGHKITEEIVSKEDARNLYKLKGSNYYIKDLL